MKNVRIRSYSGPYFPAFGLKTLNRSAFSPYSVRMRENADRNNSERGHFLCNEYDVAMLGGIFEHFGNDNNGGRSYQKRSEASNL